MPIVVSSIGQRRSKNDAFPRGGKQIAPVNSDSNSAVCTLLQNADEVVSLSLGIQRGVPRGNIILFYFNFPKRLKGGSREGEIKVSR